MRQRKRILIFSASFGSGHRSASEALYRYLQTHYRSEAEARVVDFFQAFTPGLNVLAKFAYEQSVQFVPELYGTYFDLTNKLPSSPLVEEIERVGYSAAEKFIDVWRPDAVVSTYPLAAAVAADIRRSREGLVSATVITDFGVHRQWVHPDTDLFFVAGREVGEDLAARGVPWERIVDSGIPIHERFSQRPSRMECRREAGLENRFTVLLTSTAGTPHEQGMLARGLAQLDLQVIAVTGRGRRLRGRLQTLARRHPQLHVFGYVTEMDRMMGAADVLMGKAGGLTVSEALAMGLPLILFNPIPGQEIYNTDFLVNFGAGLSARDELDAVEKVRFLSTHPRRLVQMAENAEMLGRPGAAREVCERVLSALG